MEIENVFKRKADPVDLSKLSNIVKYDVVKKLVYDKLLKKFNGIDTCRLIKKTDLIVRSKILNIKNLILLT